MEPATGAVTGELMLGGDGVFRTPPVLFVVTVATATVTGIVVVALFEPTAFLGVVAVVGVVVVAVAVGGSFPVFTRLFGLVASALATSVLLFFFRVAGILETIKREGIRSRRQLEPPSVNQK
jgi:hypothetical protein